MYFESIVSNGHCQVIFLLLHTEGSSCFKINPPSTFSSPHSTGVPITDPKYFSQMNVEELGRVLRSDNETPMPMLRERHQVLILIRYSNNDSIGQYMDFSNASVLILLCFFTFFKSKSCLFSQGSLSIYKMKGVLFKATVTFSFRNKQGFTFLYSTSWYIYSYLAHFSAFLCMKCQILF